MTELITVLKSECIVANNPSDPIVIQVELTEQFMVWNGFP